MNAEEAISMLIDGLNESGIDYCIVGSLASNFYGIARSTQDADVVISFRPNEVHALLDALGSDFQRDPQMAFETVTGTTKTLLRVKKTKFQIELFHLSSDSHDQERFARRQTVNIFGRHTQLLSVEDVVVTKLRWAYLANRPKDLMDARAVIRIQSDNLDWPYINGWCEQHGTKQLLDRLRNDRGSD